MNENRYENITGTKEIIIDTDFADERIVFTDFANQSHSTDITIRMLGKGAKCTCIGRIIASGSEEKKWKIRLVLEGDGQVGELDVKAIAEDSSFVSIDGGGVADKKSKDGNLKITEKAFLFSSLSRAKAIPVLRVETENIASASHSASIAPFDADMFFFMASRGLCLSQAQYLMKKGILEI